MKRFVTTGPCVPEKHYMADISAKLMQIKEMIDEGSYFTINRARQYGKSTTLRLLKDVLADEYMYIRISFENAGQAMYESVAGFCQSFLWHIERAIAGSYPNQAGTWQDKEIIDFTLLSQHIDSHCKDRKIVLVIDEVDRASNFRIFLMFLSMLRNKFSERDDGIGATFYSVILAGVVDIKNIKYKMLMEGLYAVSEGEGLSVSPKLNQGFYFWNIAADFKVDMSFSPDDITYMLRQYEDDHHTGMDITAISEEIYSYTSGYPFMVSRICQCMEKDLGVKDWTLGGIQRAVKILLKESNTLFDDMGKNLENYPELYNLAYEVLIVGSPKSYQIDNPVIKFGVMFGYFRDNNDRLAISNRIFEIRMTNYFISKDETSGAKKQIIPIRSDIATNDKFDMRLCLEKFARHYKEIYNPKEDAEFLERHGRLVFLSYLKPLINGYGFYHIESQLTDYRRMDIVVDYGREQFILELKRWDGGSAHAKAYKQLAGYLGTKGADTGYLLTFDFSKKPKSYAPQWVEFGGKRIFDVIV